MTEADGALVLFSGGQDSTTCLAWALDRFARVETIGFQYGQRHGVELECRPGIRDALDRRWPGRLGPDHVLDIARPLRALGETAMTAELEITTGRRGLPTTFVPGRNLLFLAFAAPLALRRELRHVVGGMCETDFSGYPDCRDDTIKAMQVALNLGLDARLVVDTPLMSIDKAETWAMADRLGIVDVVTELTHTCYRGDRSVRHPWGHGCGTCPACRLRAEGFARWDAERSAHRSAVAG